MNLDFSKIRMQLCGNVANYMRSYKHKSNEYVQVHAFLNRMDLAYAAADVIISRAGASSVSELCVVGSQPDFYTVSECVRRSSNQKCLAVAENKRHILLKGKDLDQLLKLSFRAIIASENNRISQQHKRIGFAKRTQVTLLMK